MNNKIKNAPRNIVIAIADGIPCEEDSIFEQKFDDFENLKSEIYDLVWTDICTTLPKELGDYTKFNIDYHDPYIPVANRLLFLLDPAGQGVIKFFTLTCAGTYLYIPDEDTISEVEEVYIFLDKVQKEFTLSTEEHNNSLNKLVKLFKKATNTKCSVFMICNYRDEKVDEM